MRKILFTTLVLGAVWSVFAADRGLEIADLKEPVSRPATGIEQVRASRIGLDEIIYFETWDEGDFAGWVAVDNTAQPSTWHTDDYNAYGGTGESWWVGDPAVGANGGYQDSWYMTLDSPEIQLGATPNMSFFHRFNVEVPGGEPAGYNGWDGMNIRISTNGGQTWTVIPSPVPAYTRTSLYSFGFEHGEGVNIPGWCGAGATWAQVTANLATWANQTVKIRWAFASDPAYSTGDNAALFGWMVDNIRVYNGAGDTVLANDGVPATFSTGTNVPVGGNLWRVMNDATAPTEPHVIICNNSGTNLYNPNMNNEFISPNISIAGLANGILTADVQITGEVICPTDSFPDCDFWGMQISTNGGLSWCYASNPSCDPNGDNYVYTDMPTTWASFNDSYSTPMDLSAYLGVYD
ncbi:hypothetical protein IT157_03035, partial [bacterium]|nr:hypothetical protein [bacterium]